MRDCDRCGWPKHSPDRLCPDCRKVIDRPAIDMTAAANQFADALAVLDAPHALTNEEAEKLGAAMAMADKIITAREAE